MNVNRIRARQLRKNPTDAERLLWQKLRFWQVNGCKFRRQQPLGNFIVDFVCLEKRLVIEVDGGQHAQNESDRRRDDWLRCEGYQVMRFWNDDVLKRTNLVLDAIVETIGHGKDATPLPARFAHHPLPQGERGQQPRR